MNENYTKTDYNKRKLYILGPLILLIALVGVTYAFFNYTRTGIANNIGTGRIYFNSTQGNTLYLTNMFPMASGEASNANLDSISINIVGDTTYNNGQEFEISLVNVNNTITSGSTEKTIPVNYIASYVPTAVATGEDPNNIGTSSNDYFNDRGSTTAVYKLNATGVVSEGEQVLIGYIPANIPVNGTLTIKTYLDGSNIAISDTYPSDDVTHIETSGETSSEVLDYTDGTTSEWVNGRTVLTTTEWNTLQTTPISFKIKAESNEGIWVEEPIVLPTYASCPSEDCVYLYPLNHTYYYGENGSVLQEGDYSRDYNDVLDDDQVIFIAAVLDNNNKIKQAFACGVMRDWDADIDEPTYGEIKEAFCIEGLAAGDGRLETVNSSNASILQSESLWNGECDTGTGGGLNCWANDNRTAASFNATGGVTTGDGLTDISCIVHNASYFNCF